MSLDDPDAAAAAAARDATPLPDEIIEGRPLGECPDCGARFDYMYPSGVGNLEPCPECGSHDWQRWGVRMPDGEEIPSDEVGE